VPPLHILVRAFLPTPSYVPGQLAQYFLYCIASLECTHSPVHVLVMQVSLLIMAQLVHLAGAFWWEH